MCSCLGFQNQQQKSNQGCNGGGRGSDKTKQNLRGFLLGSIHLSLITTEPCSLMLLILASQSTIEDIYITA